MLPVLLFVAFWVVLGLGLFLVAVRGGPAGVRATLQTQSLGGRRAAGLSFVVAYVGFGVVLPVVFLTGNHANASAQYAGLKLTAAEKSGRELFGAHCGICHTLAAANAVGKVGPDLDQIQPSESLDPAHDQQRLPPEPAVVGRQRDLPGPGHDALRHPAGQAGPGRRGVRRARGGQGVARAARAERGPDQPSRSFRELRPSRADIRPRPLLGSRRQPLNSPRSGWEAGDPSRRG